MMSEARLVGRPTGPWLQRRAWLGELLFSSLLWLTASTAVLGIDAAKLPPAAARPVDFAKEIKPLFEATCVKCHAKGKDKGGFSLETRESFLKGGDSGAAAVLGKSAESPIVEMVAALDPDNTMPKKGTKWTPEQVGLLRAWIDQEAPWPASITFAKPAPQNLQPRSVTPPEGAEENPIDRLLAPYYHAQGFTPPPVIEDRLFARRAWLDAIGLIPTPEQLAKFLADSSPTKRADLVRSLLADHRGYADHWLTFWNDLLRNDYRGTGFIDGGRKQITEWLYDALLDNKPYDKFVAELIEPSDQTLGFTAGIIWRGTVPAAMTPPLQAAQSVSQVFLGVNLKCASCHDSFVNDWSLADAYGMAALFSETDLELVHCDKPTGKKAAVRFLYPQLGTFAAGAPRADRLRQLAGVMTAPANGRLSRTLVNRLWARLLGRGLVEPTDDMDQPAWAPEVLDWLAEDFVAHGYDIRHTLETIMTSRAYALATVEGPRPLEKFVFHGPLTRRLTAEQFTDAVNELTDGWAPLPSSLEFDFTGQGRTGDFAVPHWVWTDETLDQASQRIAWRYVQASAAAAAEKSATARKLIERGDPKASAAMQDAQSALSEATAVGQWALGPLETYWHKVVFRKHFTLAEAPRLAYGTLAATQAAEVKVNGTLVKQKMADGWRNGRIRLYDFTPLLRAGENTIAIGVESHTEKTMNETERKQFPASTQHLNAVPGLAFYLRSRAAGGDTELITDASWRVRRAPEGAWGDPALADADWAKASLLPPEIAPVDEGPGLEPIRRQDFANQPARLAPALRAATSTAAFADHIRASMLFADPLQAALDRPNREIVTPSRNGVATTLQALELTNGATLSSSLQRGAKKLVATAGSTGECVDRLYHAALGRAPSEPEAVAARELLGPTPTEEGITDLLWALVMLPEFQLIN